MAMYGTVGDPLADLIDDLSLDLKHASVPLASSDPRQRPTESLLYVYRLKALLDAFTDIKQRLETVEHVAYANSEPDFAP